MRRATHDTFKHQKSYQKHADGRNLHDMRLHANLARNALKTNTNERVRRAGGCVFTLRHASRSSCVIDCTRCCGSQVRRGSGQKTRGVLMWRRRGYLSIGRAYLERFTIAKHMHNGSVQF
jgi:hypothetical protein